MLCSQMDFDIHVPPQADSHNIQTAETNPQSFYEECIFYCQTLQRYRQGVTDSHHHSLHEESDRDMGLFQERQQHRQTARRLERLNWSIRQ